MKNKTILLISPEAWGTNFVSKHHYASYLAKNNSVYFLNPVNNSIINPFGNIQVKVDKIKKNLVQVNYKNLLPRLNILPKFIQQYIYQRQAKQIQKTLNIKTFDIVWSFDPYRFWNQHAWNADKKIYHTVDFHYTSKYEDEIIQSSTNCLSISKHIPTKKKFKKFKMRTISHGYKINNEKITHQEIPGENKIKAVYVGNVLNLLNKERLNNLAKSHTKVDFILIGPNKKSNLSLSQNEPHIVFEKNVHLLGEKPSHIIESYLQSCDINLLIAPKPKGEYHINSHKLMHYFNSGNITISDWLLDYEGNDILDMVKTPENFETLFLKIINNLDFYNSVELIIKRKQFALANSYHKKIEEMSNLIYPQ